MLLMFMQGNCKRVLEHYWSPTYSRQVPTLANARVSTEDRDISALDFFKERRYVILKYFRHMTSQKPDLVLGEIRSATSIVELFCFNNQSY